MNSGVVGVSSLVPGLTPTLKRELAALAFVETEDQSMIPSRRAPRDQTGSGEVFPVFG